MGFTPGGLGGGGGGGGGGATARVYTPAVALFEHPEDATATFLADTGSTEGLTVTLREPLEYGQDTSQWSIVGAQRYQGVAAVNAGITGQTFAHARYLGEFATANAPARDSLTTPHLFYDTTLNLFQIGDQNTDWDTVDVTGWRSIFGQDPVYRPWSGSGGWANDFGNAGAYEFADQDAVEASLTTNYGTWTSGSYNSSANVVWYDQSADDVKIFGAVTAPVAEVPADPVHVVVDRAAMRITAYYNLAAGGALTEADTLGDLKGAFDTAAEGLSSEYVGGGAATDVMMRPFATVDQFSAADLRGLRLLLTDPVAAGAAGNNFGLVARDRFPGGAEVQARQAHILIYSRSDRRGGVRINLDAGINGLNEHGVPVDVSTGELGNEWTFTAVDGTLSQQNVVTVNPANREIVYYALSTVDQVGANTLRDAVNQGGNGVSATTFGTYNGNAHVFTGSIGNVNPRPQRFHGGRDYHAATTNPEPITVTEGPTHAHTRLYTVADGGIVLSVTNPAHDGGNGFQFEASEGALAAALLPTEERITLAIPSAGALASAILAALNAVDGLAAVYFGTEDGTTTVQHSRFGRHEMLGGLDATEIEIQYAPVASGGIANVDTMGDVKTAWDAGDGRSSFYYNGADAATEASRLVPWEHRFENGRTDVISLAGFGLGPEQNEFTGADRAAAEAARDTYATANPTWVEAYRGQPAVWIVLRWGTAPGTQIGQTLRANASNPPVAGDWIDQNIALRGEMGSRGSQGSYDVEIYQNAATNPGRPTGGSVVVATGAVTPSAGWATTESQPPAGQDTFRARARINPSTQSGTVTPAWGLPVDIRAEVSDADIDARIKPYARTAGPQIMPGDADDAFMLDSEFTAAAVRTLIGLTAAQLDDLVTGGSISGRTVTLNQADGTTITFMVPPDTNTQDGVLASGSIDAAGTTLTLTLDTGTDITVSIPDALRMGGGGGVTLAQIKEFARTGERGVQVGDMDSTGATDNQVPTADGSGGVAWEDQQDPPAPPAGMHLRYFGWKAAGAIVTADLDDTLARTNSSTTDTGQYPANDVQATRWFAVPETEGVPTEHYLPPNPLNTIIGFTRQAGTIDDANGEAHIVMVATAQTPITAAATDVRIGHN